MVHSRFGQSASSAVILDDQSRPDQKRLNHVAECFAGQSQTRCQHVQPSRSLSEKLKVSLLLTRQALAIDPVEFACTPKMGQRDFGFALTSTYSASGLQDAKSDPGCSPPTNGDFIRHFVGNGPAECLASLSNNLSEFCWRQVCQF